MMLKNTAALQVSNKDDERTDGLGRPGFGGGFHFK
jgi:hypothetical protein